MWLSDFAYIIKAPFAQVMDAFLTLVHNNVSDYLKNSFAIPKELHKSVYRIGYYQASCTRNERVVLRAHSPSIKIRTVLRTTHFGQLDFR